MSSGPNMCNRCSKIRFDLHRLVCRSSLSPLEDRTILSRILKHHLTSVTTLNPHPISEQPTTSAPQHLVTPHKQIEKQGNPFPRPHQIATGSPHTTQQPMKSLPQHADTGFNSPVTPMGRRVTITYYPAQVSIHVFHSSPAHHLSAPSQ